MLGQVNSKAEINSVLKILEVHFVDPQISNYSKLKLNAKLCSLVQSNCFSFAPYFSLPSSPKLAAWRKKIKGLAKIPVFPIGLTTIHIHLNKLGNFGEVRHSNTYGSVDVGTHIPILCSRGAWIQLIGFQQISQYRKKAKRMLSVQPTFSQLNVLLLWLPLLNAHLALAYILLLWILKTPEGIILIWKGCMENSTNNISTSHPKWPLR